MWFFDCCLSQEQLSQASCLSLPLLIQQTWLLFCKQTHVASALQRQLPLTRFWEIFCHPNPSVFWDQRILMLPGKRSHRDYGKSQVTFVQTKVKWGFSRQNGLETDKVLPIFWQSLSLLLCFHDSAHPMAFPSGLLLTKWCNITWMQQLLGILTVKA